MFDRTLRSSSVRSGLSDMTECHARASGSAESSAVIAKEEMLVASDGEVQVTLHGVNHAGKLDNKLAHSLMDLIHPSCSDRFFSVFSHALLSYPNRFLCFQHYSPLRGTGQLRWQLRKHQCACNRNEGDTVCL